MKKIRKCIFALLLCGAIAFTFSACGGGGGGGGGGGDAENEDGKSVGSQDLSKIFNTGSKWRFENSDEVINITTAQLVKWYRKKPTGVDLYTSWAEGTWNASYNQTAQEFIVTFKFHAGYGECSSWNGKSIRGTLRINRDLGNQVYSGTFSYDPLWSGGPIGRNRAVTIEVQHFAN